MIELFKLCPSSIEIFKANSIITEQELLEIKNSYQKTFLSNFKATKWRNEYLPLLTTIESHYTELKQRNKELDNSKSYGLLLLKYNLNTDIYYLYNSFSNFIVLRSS